MTLDAADRAALTDLGSDDESEEDTCPACLGDLTFEPHARGCPENDPAHDHEFWEDR